MGKDPSAVVLVTALAFCAFCPFFARCDKTEINFIKGIASLSNVLVKYQTEFDRKVKFVELQEAIDEIGNVMLGYDGKAKDKLPMIRSLNYDARLSYKNCVGPVFDWCQSLNGIFDIIIDKIGDSNLSETNRNIIRHLTVSTLELGLTETGKSLECQNHFRNRMGELNNAFYNILNYVHDDLGPWGFYAEKSSSLDRHLTAIFTVVTKIFNWKQPQTYEERKEIVKRFLTQTIENGTEIVKDMESNLEEDNTNLHKLRGSVVDANHKKALLLSHTALRVRFIPIIKHLKDSCDEYVNWHGFDAPFYRKNRSRTRRAASTFNESESSPA